MFLGTNNPTPVKNINLDYLYTALQAVYGSAQPPFVTLNPSASAYTAWTDFGNGNGIFELGEWAASPSATTPSGWMWIPRWT